MKTKYILLLLLSLLIGILIGSLTTGRFTRSKVEKIKSWNTREGFRTHLFDIMEATKDQQDLLRPLLDSFSDLHWKMINKNWEAQNLFFDEMYKAIEPKIEKQQFQKLMEHRDEIRSERQKKKTEREN